MKESEARDVLREIWPALRAEKVWEVALRYSGSGDSGSFEEPTIVSSDGEGETFFFCEVTVKAVTKMSTHVNGSWVEKVEEEDVTLEDALQMVGYWVLEAQVPGWEINEGSTGEVRFNSRSFSVTLHHTEYVMEERQHPPVERFYPPPDLEKLALAGAEE